MALTKFLTLGLVAIAPLVSGYQPLRNHLTARDDPYPFCSPSTNPNCIDGGRYLVPILDWAGENGPADKVYQSKLPQASYHLDQWTNGQWPTTCRVWGVDADHFVASDFLVYNVTYADGCKGVPWVVCYHKRSSKTIDDIAKVVGKIPIGMRQATSVYMSYSLDNSQYGGAIATLAGDGLIVGRSDYYFTTALVHEHGHAVDSNLIGVNGGAYSATSAWSTAVNNDYCAVSAYGAGSLVEDFAETGRAVLLDNIYTGGLKAFSNNNPNITQISNQVSTGQAVMGKYYKTGGTCTKKYRFPPTEKQ